MWYVIVGEDVQDSLGKRLATRPAHVQRLEALKTQGRLLLAGPFPTIDAPDPGPAGYTGSLIVAEFDTLDAAQQWANEDPYLVIGDVEIDGAERGEERYPYPIEPVPDRFRQRDVRRHHALQHRFAPDVLTAEEDHGEEPVHKGRFPFDEGLVLE